MSQNSGSLDTVPLDYAELLAGIRQRVQHAQVRAVLAVNAELIRLYWEVGELLDRRQQQEGWGKAVVPRLARDLHNELPEVKGFSERNINRMLAFYREYPDLLFLPQAVAKMASAPRELETGLVAHIEKFLLELGQGFAFVGRQYHLDIGEQDFSIDLLFYHLEPRRYMVIGLKRGDFKPEYAGKVNFYCSVVDDKLRHEDDQPTIGLILCQQPNRILAEYALRGMDKPIGVSSFELTRALPDTLQTSLPSVEQIERELQGAELE